MKRHNSNHLKCFFTQTQNSLCFSHEASSHESLQKSTPEYVISVLLFNRKLFEVLLIILITGFMLMPFNDDYYKDDDDDDDNDDDDDDHDDDSDDNLNCDNTILS
uniref:Uncharacterized protein n=1 Tax=Glossina austeni TaxID=7395 RepID=A0A1A9VTR8_GLOAU